MKRINKEILFIILFFLSNICWSQDQFSHKKKVKLAISAHLTYCTLRTPDFPDNPYYDGNRILFGGGAFVTISLGKKFYLQPELSLEAIGGQGKATFNEEINTNLLYLDLPIVLKYEFVKKFALETGIVSGYLLSANYKQAGDKTENRSSYQDFNFSLIIGTQYLVNKNWAIGLRAQPGIYNIWKYQSALTLKTFGVNLRTAYTF